MKQLFTLLIVLLYNIGYCQTENYSVSNALDLPQKGWNKVLQVRNGNTVLIHFEVNKPMIVKVFDKEHKEIASQSHLCKVLDIKMLEFATFKGFYDINGEAVLFIKQSLYSKQSLIRIRFNTDNGNIIEEKMILTSEGVGKITSFYVLKQNSVDSYAIFCYRDIISKLNQKPEVVFYNSRHEVYNTLPINVTAKEPNSETVSVVGADIDNYGDIILTLETADYEIEKIRSSIMFNYEPYRKYNQYLNVIFMSKNGKRYRNMEINLNNDMYSAYTCYSYNSFANTINLIDLEMKNLTLNKGINIYHDLYKASLLFVIPENDTTVKYNWLVHDKINKNLYQNDTAQRLDCLPLQMFTDKNGLTTLISEEYFTGSDIEHGDAVPVTKIGKIAFTRLGDNGNIIWDTTITEAQYIRYNINAHDLAHRNVSKDLFRQESLFKKVPENDFLNEFFSASCYESGREIFFICNDYKQNFSNTSMQADTVFDFTYADGIYYKADKKNNISKHYLFGAPAEGEDKSCAIESGCFDDKTNMYAALIMYRKGEEITTHIAWSHLE